MITRPRFIQGSVALAAVATLGSRRARSADTTALDRYIATPTPEYRFETVETFDAGAHRTRIVSMVSQRWRSPREVDKPLWQHWLTITEPQRLKTSVAVLIVSGGSNTDEPPRTVDPVIGALAQQIGAVVAELHMVPNQPLQFADEAGARGEDDLVAYSWDKYLRTGDETWPLHLPMTKAVVRAMDTIAALSRQAGDKPRVDSFVVGGSSKRGWTTWLTAAADKRVIAIVPVVIDVLNVERSVEHAYQVYGTWAEALRPYEHMGIMKWLGTPQLEALLSIEDPYAYRDRITVPKLIVNATGDEFFTPDSSQFYFSGLHGEKYLRYVPNTDHSLRGAGVNAARTGMAFLDSIVASTPRPKYSWVRESEGTIRVHSRTKAASAKLWQASNHHARDFRLQTIGRAFTSSELDDQGNFTYVADVPRPTQGFAAYFVELAYTTAADDVFTVTTDVCITPDVLPFHTPPQKA